MINFNNIEKAAYKEKEKPDIRFVATKEIKTSKDGVKYIYKVNDNLLSREVLKWTNKTSVDDAVKDYIDRCYSKKNCLIKF